MSANNGERCPANPSPNGDSGFDSDSGQNPETTLFDSLAVRNEPASSPSPDPAVGSRRRATSPALHDRLTSIARTLDYASPVGVHEHDYRRILPETLNTVTNLPSFTVTPIALGLPVRSITAEEMALALKAGLVSTTTWQYPFKLAAPAHVVRAYKANVMASWTELIAATESNHGVSTRANWVPRFVVGFYPHVADSHVPADTFARDVASWAITNAGHFHRFFNWMLQYDKDVIPSASAMYDAAVALRDVVDTALLYVLAHILVPNASELTPVVSAARLSIKDTLSALCATFDRFKNKRASQYLIDYANLVKDAKFTPKFYFHTAGALMSVLITKTSYFKSDTQWTLDMYKELAPVVLLAVRLSMLVAGRPARLGSVNNITLANLNTVDTTTDADGTAMYPASYLGINSDGNPLIPNDINFIAVHTKNASGGSDVDFEWLPVPAVAVLLLRKMAAIARVVLPNAASSPLAVPYWQNVQTALPGHTDAAARGHPLVHKAIALANVSANLDAPEDRLVTDFAAIAHSRFIRKHIDQVVNEIAVPDSLDQILNVGMGHSQSVSELFYSRTAHTLDVKRIAIFKHIRESVCNRTDGPFFLLAATHITNDAVAQDDDDTADQLDLLAPATPASSSTIVPRSPGSTQAKWSSLREFMLRISEKIWAAPNSRTTVPYPTQDIYMRWIRAHPADPDVVRVLREVIPRQVANKVKNELSKVKRATGPLVTIFPDEWVDAIKSSVRTH